MKHKLFLVAFFATIPAFAGAGQVTPDQAKEYVKISEVMVNPEGADTGAEWVELQNVSGTEFDITGWILDDSGTNNGPGSGSYVLPQTVIQPGQRLVVTIPKGKFSLNNTSPDSLRMFLPDGQLVEIAEYAGGVKEGETWCLIGEAFRWCIPTQGTQNATAKTETDNKEEDTVIDYVSLSLKIAGVMADPVGIDSGNEYVVLRNDGPEKLELENWLLDDGISGEVGSSAYALGQGSLEPGDEMELLIPAGKFSLNNSGQDGVRLFSPDKILRDFVTYDKSKEGLLYAKVSGEWVWVEHAEDSDVTNNNGITHLPTTGLSIYVISFVILVAICYIVLGSGNYHITNEQTRSHRRTGN